MVARFGQALFCVLFLASCAFTQFDSMAWPESAPPRAQFEMVYAADPGNQEVQSLDEYLLWVVRYYEGWELYKRGWKHVVEDVLIGVEEPEERREIRERMADLGEVVAGEWAKKSDERLIRNRQLSIWGNALLEAIDRNEQLDMIAQIRQDVDYLLNNRVAQSDITADRYYAQDPNDVFR